MSGKLQKILNLQWLGLRRRDLFQLAGGAVLAGGVASNSDAQEGGAGPERSDIWTSYFRDKTVWGYVNKHSVFPGEKFELMLSTGPTHDGTKGHVEVFRVEPFRIDGGQRRVWRSPVMQVERQTVLRTAAAIGTHWPPTLDGIDTTGWPSGYYSIDFVEEATGARDLQIAQIVVRNPTRSGALLLKLGTNTYQAYNAWGGHSLYPTETDARGAMVSFDRPTGPAFFEYDVFLARWLEDLSQRNGFGVDYASNFDVHDEVGLLDDYRIVATGAHDEYWTKEEFDAFERRIFHHGRNTIFFGANTAYFQVRYADVNRPAGDAPQGRQIICYKGSDDPIARRKSVIDPQLLVTSRFRDNARRPETMLAGVAYQDWFPADSGPVPYYVESTSGPFFDGTGYRVGDVAADVVGYEWDNRDPAGDGQRLWDKDRSKIARIETDRIQVLFRGSASGERTNSGRAEAVYFETPAGARVFSTGSIRWSWGLGKLGFERTPFRRFNENLVTSFLRD